jgi:hypothetical protein
MDLNRWTIKFCKCANGLPRTALSVDIILLMCLFESQPGNAVLLYVAPGYLDTNKLYDVAFI